MTAHNPIDDLEAAKKILEHLKEIPSERHERILRWAMEGLGLQSPTPATAPLVARPSTDGGEGRVGGSSTDIKSFVAAKAPKSDNQFAAVVAYYYRFEAAPDQRKDAIDPDILQEATRLAGRARLGNPRATLNNAKSAGYLDSDTPGQFSVNSVGENLVAMTLPGAGTMSSTRSKKSQGAKKKKTR